MDKEAEMTNGAKADMLYANIADYLMVLSKSMLKKYRQRQREGQPITWAELDKVNKDLHHQLDIIIAGDMSPQLCKAR